MIKYIGRSLRLIVIAYQLTRYGFIRYLLSTRLISRFSFVRLIIHLNPIYWLSSKHTARGEALRLSLESLGPIFVKFGQALSTRTDLFPEDIIASLSLLQDKVAPFPGERARAVIEAEYHQPIYSLFKEFDLTPLASASIAQVHPAKLLDGTEVVVKILRPQVDKVIRHDVDLLYMFAEVAEFFNQDLAKRLKVKEVVAEFERTLFDELDLVREAANASQLQRNFERSDSLYIPKIYWLLVRTKVLVQERVQGIPISDIATLKAHHINLKALAERGVEIFFTQVFRDCFFHADMHPGNIFVSFDHKNLPQYIAVDFGIMGSLNRHDQHYLAENFLAFFHRDYRRVAELHVESGWVPYDTRVDEFEAAIRTVCEPIFAKPLKEISYGQVLMRLFQVGSRFNMQVQPQLILLQKTLFAIEGLGRQLYPELDLWNTAKPFLERWMRQRVSIKYLWRRFKEYAPYYAEKLPELPMLLNETLTYVHRRQLEEQSDYSNRYRKKHLKKERKIFKGILVLSIGIFLGYLLSQTSYLVLLR